MKRIQRMVKVVSFGCIGLGFASCAMREEPKRKPVPPKSTTSNMPWNTPQDGQGAGQMGMLSNMMQGR